MSHVKCLPPVEILKIKKQTARETTSDGLDSGHVLTCLVPSSFSSMAPLGAAAQPIPFLKKRVAFIHPTSGFRPRTPLSPLSPLLTKIAAILHNGIESQHNGIEG